MKNQGKEMKKQGKTKGTKKKQWKKKGKPKKIQENDGKNMFLGFPMGIPVGLLQGILFGLPKGHSLWPPASKLIIFQGKQTKNHVFWPPKGSSLGPPDPQRQNWPNKNDNLAKLSFLFFCCRPAPKTDNFAKFLFFVFWGGHILPLGVWGLKGGPKTKFSLGFP